MIQLILTCTGVKINVFILHTHGKIGKVFCVFFKIIALFFISLRLKLILLSVTISLL